jgi:hypothetical protein
MRHLSKRCFDGGKVASAIGHGSRQHSRFRYFLCPTGNHEPITLAWRPARQLAGCWPTSRKRRGFLANERSMNEQSTARLPRRSVCAVLFQRWVALLVRPRS